MYIIRRCVTTNCPGCGGIDFRLRSTARYAISEANNATTTTPRRRRRQRWVTIKHAMFHLVSMTDRFKARSHRPMVELRRCELAIAVLYTTQHSTRNNVTVCPSPTISLPLLSRVSFDEPRTGHVEGRFVDVISGKVVGRDPWWKWREFHLVY